MEDKKSTAIAEEYRQLLCDVLNERGITDNNICNKLIDIFSTTEKHVTVDEFCQLLKEQGHPLDKEFVSLVLSTFSEFGFARELQLEGENFIRYEHLHPHTHHDHFICIKCKKIIEFSDRELEHVQDAFMFQRKFRPIFHKLEVYGICNKCSYTEREPIPITFVPEETLVRLYRIERGWNLKRRLTELGFIENEPIRIVKNSGFGPIVLEVKGSRFAIGRGQAQKILVYEQK